MPDAATEARELVRIVASDTALPVGVRRRALDLGRLAAVQPDLALLRLADLREGVVPKLAAAPPETDLARFVGIEVFWRRHLRPDRKAFFATPEDYRRAVETDSDPAARLLGDLGSDPVVPAANSWLVPAGQLAGLRGAEVKVRLNMGQDPPYAAMIFTARRMLAAGVVVRTPCGLDAVPSRLVQWYPGNVPDERIDGDLPRRALETIQWRP